MTVTGLLSRLKRRKKEPKKVTRYFSTEKPRLLTRAEKRKRREMCPTPRQAAMLGTKLHAAIHRFISTGVHPLETDVAFNHFLRFHRDMKGLTFLGTEMPVGEGKTKGVIDALVEYDDEGVRRRAILDFKRCGDPYRESKKRMRPPMSHLFDTNINHWSLQLSVYKLDTEKTTGKRVDRLFSVVLHPAHKDYIVIKCDFLEAEAKTLIHKR